MAMFTKTASAIWRQYIVAGDPGSGVYNTKRPEIVTWGGEIEAMFAGTKAIDALDVAGAVTVAGAANLAALAATGGTINGVVIGGTTAAAGSFTTITGSGSATFGTVTAADVIVETAATVAAQVSVKPEGTLTWSMEGAVNGNLQFRDEVNAAYPLIVEAGASTSTLVVDSNDRVGIGLAAPVANLHVKAAAASAVVHTLEADSGQLIRPRMRFSGVDTWEWLYSETDIKLRNMVAVKDIVQIKDAPANSLYMDASGNIGLGTATPAVVLDAGGDTGAIAVPKGTTAQRPASPSAGMIRQNTDTGRFEVYDGAEWTPVGGAVEFLASQTLTTAANATFDTEFDNTLYDSYEFHFHNVVPTADNSVFSCVTSADGITYDTGGADYEYAGVRGNPSALAAAGSLGDNEIAISGIGVKNLSTVGLSGTLKLLGAGIASKTTQMISNVTFEDFQSNHHFADVRGRRNAAAVVQGIAFGYGGTTIASGTISMFGIRNG